MTFMNLRIQLEIFYVETEGEYESFSDGDCTIDWEIFVVNFCCNMVYAWYM